MLNYMRESARRKRNNTNSQARYSTCDYCNGEKNWSEALDLWIEYMKKEEEYSFYRHFTSQSLEDARNSFSLLVELKSVDNRLRMPLLRDAVTSYARPFKNSHGRLGIRLNASEMGCPHPKDMHDRILGLRDQVFAHCDISVKKPRVTVIGISLRGAGFYWEDYPMRNPCPK